MLCLTKYTAKGPSSRYRVYQFEKFLAGAGIEIDVQALHDESYLETRFKGDRTPVGYLLGRFARRIAALFSVKKYDLVFVQKEIFPYMPGFVEALLQRAGAKIVLDLDDAIFLFYERAASPLKRNLLRRKIPRVISRSSLVLAGNRYLETYARQFTDKVVLFPTVVDTDRFSPAPEVRERRVPVVGWIGSPETKPFLEDIVPSLEAASSEVEFSFSVVGADGPGMNGVSVAAKAWSYAEEVEDLRGFDVGVMPLPDTEWTKGKCALKLLQYMSVGVPAISSPRSSAVEITENGRNGFLADGHDEWRRRLIELLRDRDLRTKIGKNGRDWVVGHYSLSKYGPKLAGYLRAVVEGRSAVDV